MVKMTSPISPTRARPAMATWLGVLLLFITTQFQAVYAAAASTLFIGDTNTTISINVAPDSDDVNLFVSSPDFFQYTAVGFGNSMADSLILVMYPAADNRRITISPRLSTGHTEPLFTPSIRLTIHGNSGIREHEMIVNATCHNCRTWATGSLDVKSTAQSMLFANGPGTGLSSDDPAASIRRHVGHGRFTMNLAQATGPDGVFTPPVGGSNITTGAVFVDGGVHATERSQASTAHGIVFVVAILVIAPADALIAGALKRWPSLHAVSATVYVAMVIGALVPGLAISREHVATRNFLTGHQVLGFLSVSLLFALYLWGIGLAVVRRKAKSGGQDTPPQQFGAKNETLGKIHRWTGRFLWVLFVVAGGLGLRLAERNYLFMMGYGVLVGAVFIVGLPIWFCIWRCTKFRKEMKEEEEHELQYSIYNHQHNQ